MKNQKISTSLKKAYLDGRRKSFQPNPPKPCPDTYKLRDLYVNKQMGSWKIGKLFGVSQKLVLKWLRDNDIELRTLSEASVITRNGFKNAEGHWNWKGDEVGYQSLHTWVRKHKGTPQSCDFCGTTDKRKYEWANKDHKYSRNLDDWFRLCTSCHRKYDKDNNFKE